MAELIDYKPYKPHKVNKAILDRAMAHVQSVPYRVTLRWLFYRLLQDGTYSDKEHYRSRFKPLLSRARKGFYGDWRPDTLADDTREAVYRGYGSSDALDWLNNDIYSRGCNLDKWQGQSHYVEVWFEAAAMRSQFEHYSRSITLRAFQGDPSLDFKWTTAKDLEEVAGLHPDKPIVILYFGDLDEKGLQIPESAAADVRAWCEADFEFIRCGLNPGDEVRFDLPEQIDKLGVYQWEALSDDDARGLILGNITQYVDFDAKAAIVQREQAITERFREELSDIIRRWARDVAGDGGGG